MDSLLELFCDVDDFCIAFLPFWNQQLLISGKKQRQCAVWFDRLLSQTNQTIFGLGQPFTLARLTRIHVILALIEKQSPASG